MKISIQDFATIAEAEINIRGLTVIAGENDTGKSTVGKILFSFVKAISRYEDELKEDKELKLIELAETLYFSLRKFINSNKDSQLRHLFHPGRFIAQIRIDSEGAIYERLQYINELQEQNLFTSVDLESALSKLENLRIVSNENDDKATAMKKAVRKLFHSEFSGEIMYKGAASESARVSIRDGQSHLIRAIWSQNGLSQFEFMDELGFEDATFLDTPSIIQFHNLIDGFNYSSHRSRKEIPYHIKDLSSKLKESIYDARMFNDHSDLNKRFSDTYKGRFHYDKDIGEFVLDRGTYKIGAGNVASGIKSLGIFDMLILSGHASSKSLLIIDEPEVNLHPKWQIEYARTICDLVARGAKIIVTTHSPYILEALKGFSMKQSLLNDFYLAKKSDDRSTFINVTEDISAAVSALSEPLYNLNDEIYDDF